MLDFTNNRVSHLSHLSHLKDLEDLWASNNQLSNFDEVERELRDKENLQTVYFEGNPLQTKGPAVYRNKLRLALPQIKQIDASECSWTIFKKLRVGLLTLLQHLFGFDGDIRGYSAKKSINMTVMSM